MDGCPSNLFAFGKLQRKARKGTAVLHVIVPGPGELAGSGKGVAAVTKTVGAAGDVPMLIKARGKKKRKLNQTGNVKVGPSITFTPTGGLPSTQPRQLKLRKRLPG
jgi:hypothetical protein